MRSRFERHQRLRLRPCTTLRPVAQCHPGGNLLEPRRHPDKNMQCSAVLRGRVIRGRCHLYGRAACEPLGSPPAGNDHRSGGLTRRPAGDISVYLGSQLEGSTSRISNGRSHQFPVSAGLMQLGVGHSAGIFPKDQGEFATAPRGGAPFAFTGNRFEFRASAPKPVSAGPAVWR